MKKILQHPILILLAFNILIGLFTFKDFGLSWDEPLFYDYAKALPYAYSPKEWFSGNFNLENAYGSSGSDHANRGPAYILLAQPIVNQLENFGMDLASAWHLVNFLTFQLGVYLLYRLSKRWMSLPAATVAAAFFAWQPLLWGHAFINPKDPPFLVFFTGAVCFGFEMVDSLFENPKELTSNRTIQKLKPFGSILIAAFFLGIATSIRVLGPLAGLLVFLYSLTKLSKDEIPLWLKFFGIYGIATLLVVVVTWPYLWTNPLQRFVEAFGFMSDNPTHLQVLFNGALYEADQLPRRYLPTLLALTLTEPTWILFGAGLVVSLWTQIKKRNDLNWSLLSSFFLLLSWFFIPFLYVILRKPPMYDGYRHFLFMLPPVFIFAGFAIDKILNAIQARWVTVALLVIIFIPSVAALQLHPYEYAYYNSLTGGTSGAFRTYETDYWLTCYKDAVQQFDIQNNLLYVKREPYIAAYYAHNEGAIRDYREEFAKITTGDFVLVNTRANEDLKTFKDAPVVLQISRGDAVFCEIKKIP
jgi:hypothetical protein